MPQPAKGLSEEREGETPGKVKQCIKLERHKAEQPKSRTTQKEQEDIQQRPKAEITTARQEAKKTKTLQASKQDRTERQSSNRARKQKYKRKGVEKRHLMVKHKSQAPAQPGTNGLKPYDIYWLAMRKALNLM